MHVRCILMDFERNYRVKFLSKQINVGIRSFSTLIQFNSKFKSLWRVKLIFAIGLHKKDSSILQKIQATLGVGKIHIHGKDSVQ